MIQKLKEQVRSGHRPEFSIHQDESLRYEGGRLCIPSGKVRHKLLSEAHRSPFAMHPGGTKIYRDLKQHYWWTGMKKEVEEFVSKCIICQQVKAER